MTDGAAIELEGLARAYGERVALAGVTLSLPPGQSETLKFDQPGVYTYVCPYHAQNMKGTVTVVNR